MSRFALIGQALRADECLAFIDNHQDPWTVVTADRRWRGDLHLPATTRTIVVESNLIGVRDRARTGVRSSILGWTRSGSRLGRTVEQAIRRVKNRLRPPTGAHEPSSAGEDSSSSRRMESHTDRLLALLESAHSEDPVLELAVFDLFDLPAALAFARSHDIPVAVH